MLKRIRRRLKRLWAIYKARPYIQITLAGRLTATPSVSVGFHSHRGMAGALSFPADEKGHALATSYAKTYSHILCLPIHDFRPKPEVTTDSKFYATTEELENLK